MQKLEAELPTLVSRRERIDAKRSAAAAELELAERARLELLTESDADDAKAETNAQARVHKARSALEGFAAAAAELDAKIAAAEKSLAVEREKAERVAAADKIEADAATAEKAIEALTALRSFAETLVPLRPLSFDAKQAEEVARALAGQLARAARTVIADARSQANQIRNGTREFPTYDPSCRGQPRRRRRRCKWFSPFRKSNGPTRKGTLQVAPAFFDVNLPPAAAAKALERRWPSRSTTRERSPSVASLRGHILILKNCMPLDDAAEQEPKEDEKISDQPVINSAHFQPYDRGASYTVPVPRNTIQ